MEGENMSHTQTSWFVLHLPELGKAFENFYEKCNENGVLDKKTKELVMVALTSVFHAPNQTEEHLQRALDAGATKEEITEILLIAAAENAWTQLSSEKQTFYKYLSGKKNDL